MVNILIHFVYVNCIFSVGADAEKQFNAASTLLGLCCDAVVELDSDFCLLSHSKALAALLLRSGNLAGSCFFDLFCGTDRERAMEHLRNFGDQGRVSLVDFFPTSNSNDHIDIYCLQCHNDHFHLLDILSGRKLLAFYFRLIPW